MKPSASDPPIAALPDLPPRPDPIAELLARLLERYGALAAGEPSGGAARSALRSRNELLLAEAAWRYRAPEKPRPPQIAVIGPTQSGKSTVVNLLLGSDSAGVSALAGFTRHAHGFWTGDGQIGNGWTRDLFPGWSRVSPSKLRDDAFDAWTLTAATAPSGGFFGFFKPSGPVSPLPPCVVWDTPDFDSLAASAYHRGVTEPIALADLLLLVVSREKYADLSVWSLLGLIAPLAPRLVVCLNKTPPDAVELLRGEMASRLGQTCPAWADAPIVGMPFDPQRADRPGWAPAAALRSAVTARLASPARLERSAASQQLLRARWSEWVAPLHAERAARADWQAAVRGALEESTAAYAREFLDHPQRYDTFRQVTLELLLLLEMPVVGGAIRAARAVVTWPLRAAWQAGRRLLDTRTGPAPPPPEQFVLAELVQRLLLRLERDAGRRAAAHDAAAGVWAGFAHLLAEEGATLQSRLLAAAEQHRAAMTEDVRAAARQLYDALQDNPTLLNSLRALRAGTDVGGLVLAVKTGGIPLHDLLLAPALFGVTSLLSEGALGAYVQRVAADLRTRQMERLRSELIDGAFAPILLELEQRLPEDRLFGVSQGLFRAAEQALESAS